MKLFNKNKRYEYADIYKMKYDFTSKLRDYLVSQKLITAEFYLAIDFINDIMIKAYYDDIICQKVGRYFCNGSSLELKELLNLTKYNDSDLLHFNAFALIDSTSIMTK